MEYPNGAGCQQCPSKNRCWSAALSDADLDTIGSAVQSQLQVRKGETLLHGGAQFKSIIAVRCGSFKTQVVSAAGAERITGLHMSGEFLGLDGIAAGQYVCDAIALEASRVCVVDWARLEGLASEVPQLQRHLYAMLGGESRRLTANAHSRRNDVAEVRIARALLDIRNKSQSRGMPSTELVLRMSRQELGSYLCLTTETVSRTLTKFAADGVLEVNLRQLRILDMAALQAVVNPCNRPALMPQRVSRGWSIQDYLPVWRQQSIAFPSAQAWRQLA